MFKFDVYNFYTQGYSVGFLPADIVDQCRDLINQTQWQDDGNHVKYPSWYMLSEDMQDVYYQEIIRSLRTLGSAPSEMKYIGDQILSLPYFDELKQRLVKAQHRDRTWTRTFVPHGYGLWDGQSDLPWHSDINDSNDITILAYFTQNGTAWNDSWNGQLQIGVEDQQGRVHQVYEHYPIDGTFVVLNNMNPLFQHRVIGNLRSKHRYTMSFGHCIK